MKKYIVFGSVISLSPLFAFAAADAWSILTRIQSILNILIPLLVTVAVVYFIWGVIQYTISSDEEAKKNARSKIIMGLIGLFVIIAFWGIVNVMTRTLDVRNDATPVLPCVPNPSLGINGGC
ncbi:hypothetical protein IT400_02495 [Candidatus Nomurabacteria bacterium]|nr:hypothetical protein [Candidatus Nomurabacteria bacterium]